ncbi:nucleotide sugar dehydrogenase [Niveispirillum sp. KHB5.9]|uniref:nucleotide sugar dehydrogenase n=1 Tax=Niveispirillum sp. KHB5.9 TaxID=3400269 RepID=UPI003A8927F8
MSEYLNDSSVADAGSVGAFVDRIKRGDITVGIVGMGYVGLPLALAMTRHFRHVRGFDIDQSKVEALNTGDSYIRQIPATLIGDAVKAGRLSATADFAELRDVDAIILCVPTPLSPQREPDLTYIVKTTNSVRQHLRRGHVVVLESTTYPGTTAEVVRPILEETGLKCGTDFFLAYSPEREDPGNVKFKTETVPKVVGADDPASQALACALYEGVVVKVVPVSTMHTAEATKLTENIFRAVNIALVNELKMVFDRMGIDVWEVIEAAKTKPFGFMPFYPGPGLGGHCIPIDPFYLTWKAREYEISTKFIELAGEINTAMPRYVIARTAETLDERFGKALSRSKVLVVGLAYKKNVDDVRESPAFKVLEFLERRGTQVDYYDPFVPVIPDMREHPDMAGRRSITWSPDELARFDAAIIVTDHDNVDYQALVQHCPLVVDTRNATRGVTGGEDRIVRA